MALTKDELVELARAAAAKHGLDAALVCAVCEQESGWNIFAMRYESGFRAKYVAPKHWPPTEEVARSISWGLMQVMGEDAREFGFAEKFLVALSDPATGLDLGCQVLAHKLKVEQGNVERGLLAWNGGANANYAGEVMARLRNYP